MADQPKELTLAERWAIDEKLADERDGIWDVDHTKPARWEADDLADLYGPDATPPEPIPDNAR